MKRRVPSVGIRIIAPLALLLQVCLVGRLTSMQDDQQAAPETAMQALMLDRH